MFLLLLSLFVHTTLFVVAVDASNWQLNLCWVYFRCVDKKLTRRTGGEGGGGGWQSERLVAASDNVRQQTATQLQCNNNCKQARITSRAIRDVCVCIYCCTISYAVSCSTTASNSGTSTAIAKQTEQQSNKSYSLKL